MRVGIFGSKYQVEKQSQIKRLFEKLISQEAEIYVDVRFYNFLTDILNYEPPVAGLLTDDNFDLDVALSEGGDGTFLRTAAGRIFLFSELIPGVLAFWPMSEVMI